MQKGIERFEPSKNEMSLPDTRGYARQGQTEVRRQRDFSENETRPAEMRANRFRYDADGGAWACSDFCKTCSTNVARCSGGKSRANSAVTRCVESKENAATKKGRQPGQTVGGATESVSGICACMFLQHSTTAPSPDGASPFGSAVFAQQLCALGFPRSAIPPSAQ